MQSFMMQPLNVVLQLSGFYVNIIAHNTQLGHSCVRFNILCLTTIQCFRPKHGFFCRVGLKINILQKGTDYL